ncbi:6-phosphogluconate dehydrogenase [Aquimarina sp. AD10]|uniref:6-phosphogluconate dehydrogenase n=1 Tax=Aquimarina sp. AD10 TaxID=1714849 RepID=UPI000E4B4D24|nr:6-phosphogluconate dehydrogenase [Aquimarina sp. AD10]AXT60165.1 6-phosphogluconate dehydrogenase [Aquimarina sp. AD10]RKN00041.1 6-phosphogluconate dehydrogenase [Aquimarina sp. AD10]
MKKVLTIIITVLVLLFAAWYAFIYYASYSEGTRSGELIKFSNKGVLVKTWEGEISQGISGAQIFSFSVEDKNKKIIEKLEKFQGRYVKLKYKERFAKISWLGDTKYFVIDVVEEVSPHFRNK